jgi:hypothetical protein
MSAATSVLRERPVAFLGGMLPIRPSQSDALKYVCALTLATKAPTGAERRDR